MSKFYKFTGYLLDINEEFNGLEDYIDYINEREIGSGIDCFDIQECELEWDDDIDLNNCNCTREQMDKYFY